jgi:hypothetical protein
MKKLMPVRFAVIAALVGSAALAAALPGTVASAKGVKPPITVTCTGLLGNTSSQLESGCVGTAKSKVSSYGVAVVNSGDTTGTVYWTDKTTTTISFTYASVTNTCPSYLGVAASLEEAETATVTGGNSKLTLETAPPSDVCVYIGGDGTYLIVGDGPYTI